MKLRLNLTVVGNLSWQLETWCSKIALSREPIMVVLMDPQLRAEMRFELVKTYYPPFNLLKWSIKLRSPRMIASHTHFRTRPKSTNAIGMRFHSVFGATNIQMVNGTYVFDVWSKCHYENLMNTMRTNDQ